MRARAEHTQPQFVDLADLADDRGKITDRVMDKLPIAQCSGDNMTKLLRATVQYD